MQHDRLFAPIRARTQHWLGGYLARREVEDGIDDYIVPPGLGDRSGILGALRLAMAADTDANARTANGMAPDVPHPDMREAMKK